MGCQKAIYNIHKSECYQFSSVQSLSHIWLFATPGTAGASLPITDSWSLLRPMSIVSVMPYNHLISLGFPCGSAGKEATCNAGDLGLIPGLGRSPGEGKGYPLQYFSLENSMDYIAHGVAKSWMLLSEGYTTLTKYRMKIIGSSQ